MGMRDQFSESQIANNTQAQQTVTMISILQGIAAQQQQTTQLLTQLILQGQGNGAAVAAAQAVPAPPPVPQVQEQAPAGGPLQGHEDGVDAQQGNNNNNNNDGVPLPPVPIVIPDPRAHEAVVAPPIARPRVVRTVNNSLVEGGVSLVSILGCPSSFRMMVQQWELQRLYRFVSSLSRRPFTGPQKNAWTKWSRLYNLVLDQAGFLQLKAGRIPYPRHMTRPEFFRRMNEAADYFDSQRGGDSTDKFYKQVVKESLRDGGLEKRVQREQGI
jgi:hypothetical protein